MDLPSIFDSKGRFSPLTDDLIGTLDETRAAIYEKIKQSADVLADTENRLALATDKVRDHVETVGAFEQWMAKTFPKLTFHDLWKAEFGRRN